MNSELDINRPLFVQVKEAIEDDILNGTLKAGEQIPSNSQLVTFFGLNPVTVHKGISQLLSEGIIFKKRGLGMFVEPKAHELLQTKRQATFGDEYAWPLVTQAQILGMTVHEVCKLIENLWQEAKVAQTNGAANGCDPPPSPNNLYQQPHPTND